MNLLLISLSILTISSLLIFLFCRSRKTSAYLFLWSLVAACGFGLWSVLSVLCQKELFLPLTGLDFRLSGHLPLFEFYIGIDFLSAFFLLLFFIVSLSAGIYAYGYLREYTGQRNVGVHLALYHLLMIVIILVLVAKNAVLFLAAWELMTVVSYFLITFYNESEQVRKAGYIYLIATHVGVFCLVLMFLIMGVKAGSMNFDQMRATPFPLGLASLLFMLAFIGFGIKAGFMPFHIWLPYAHPAAPSYISALLSGVVIKVGIYGLMRAMAIVKDFPLWCGVLLLIMAAVSGVGGVLYALGQHEIKKLLAYHSIENIGIIALGLGIGMIGHAYHQDTVALLGYAAALLHTFNHAIFKGLLFLSAGSVIHSTHTGDMEHMGGLFKRLPWSGHLFLIGSLSICGLPLFNGFISEWLVFRSLLEGVFHFDIFGIIFSSMAIVALSLIGGLAALCFAKAFGVIFLGNNRSSEEHHYQEGDLIMRGPMILLAVICLWVGLFPANMVYYAFQGTQAATGMLIPDVLIEAIIGPLLMVTKVISFGGLIFVGLSLLRKFLILGYPMKLTETWVCGYANVTARMQYTSSSFAKPILKIFRTILYFKIETVRPKGYFPVQARLSSSVKDVSEYLLFRPIFFIIKRFSRRFKWIQSGHTQIYILYILFFLFVLLAWKLH
ncbi:MAG: hydrogenase [Candidatus Omnitrophica bacterium]|nr:hydrogenase [Candidatus Omnitrophota bacterium]